MELRRLGRTGLEIGILGFGCGAVGGLMVRGRASDQERAIARAIEAGVNYFDTAVQYGDGMSETNLGRILKMQGAHAAIVGTKVRLKATHFGRIRDAVRDSLEGSLHRLGRDHADILYLHNTITMKGGAESLSVRQVTDEVVPAFAALREQGKIRFLGLTAVGDTPALRQVLDTHLFDVAQIVYNILNPSAAEPLPARYPAQDYGQLFANARAADMGVVGIRVLAGGALSGNPERHDIASPPPEPIGSAASYAGDLARAQRLIALVRENYVGSLAEAATRFALTHPAMSTILVGMASPEQFESALAAVEKGKLPPEALALLETLQESFAGEAR
jgi:aryl-alcohol dehydrogenase-like predicted oxidoreductase